MRKLIIIRGIPGSGKSTKAKRLVEEYTALGLSVKWTEADDYWMADDKYQFNIDYIRHAHQWCYAVVLRSMTIEKNDVTIVSNTFTTNKEMRNYRELAATLNMPVEIIECTGEWDSVHSVPEAALERMRNRWETVEELN